MFRDLQRVQTSFTGLAAHRLFSANLAYQGQTLNSEGLEVSGSYFQVLGVQPALGRLIGPDDDRVVGESHVVVISHAYWASRFASDPKVLNQPMVVNGQTLTIVGVAPRRFNGTTLGSRPQVFVPITLRTFMEPGFMEPGFKVFDNRRSYWAYMFGRLKPGTSIESARAALGAQDKAIINDVEAPLQKGMSDQTMARFRAKPILIVEGPRGQSSVEGQAGTPLKLLLGVTAFVLLIACANIANLLLAKSSARSRRNGREAVDRRQPRTARRAVAHRVAGACHPWRAGRNPGRRMDAVPDRGVAVLRRRPDAGFPDRRNRDALRRRAGDCDRSHLRFVPRPAQHASGFGLDPERPGRPAVRCARGEVVPPDPGNGPDHHVDGSARGSGTVHESLST